MEAAGKIILPQGKWPKLSLPVSSLMPVAALVCASLLFAIFVSAHGQDPITVFKLIYQGGFGSAFSWQNTLSRASPLILVGLAVAIPAQAGMVMIGAEGALALGGLAAAMVSLYLTEPPVIIMQIAILLSGAVVGGLWFGLAGWLRQHRGINETISSLLLSYIALAIFHQLVEGPLRDPASLDKPSTHKIADAVMLPDLAGVHVHVGLVISVVVAVLSFVVLRFTIWGFALRVVGGASRVAKMVGLAVNRWVIGAAFAGGGMAGLAGAIEVIGVQGAANASLIVGYGNSGILISFLSRHNPLIILPVSLLIGGIQASGSLLQRRLGLPDATILVFQGLIFVCVIVFDALSKTMADRRPV